MKVENRILSYTEEQAFELERLRYQAYGVKNDLTISDLFYIEEMQKGQILVFVTLIDNKIAAGCYISACFNSLYVDYLFVSPDYQNTGLHIGRNLLKYILDNKEIVEQHFRCKFYESKLSAFNDKAKHVYEALGYIQNNEEETMYLHFK